jgi:hypothetical protein
MVVLGEGLPLVTSWLGANSITEALATFEIQRLPLASKANPAGLCSEPAFALSAHRNHTDCRGDRPQWLLQSVDRYDDAEWPRVGELPSGGGIGDGHESDRRYALYRDRLGKSRQSFVKEDLILMRENTHAVFLEIGFAGWRFCSRSPS